MDRAKIGTQIKPRLWLRPNNVAPEIVMHRSHVGVRVEDK
jgi:hypothetical protein